MCSKPTQSSPRFGSPLLEDTPSAPLLCIGDVMLDVFRYGETHRISPEAPIPVVVLKTSKAMVGGAGNVARNLASLGCQVDFYSLAGRDAAGQKLRDLLAGEPYIRDHIRYEGTCATTQKTRILAEHQHIIRLDEDAAAYDPQLQESFVAACMEALGHYDYVVLSDYGKGVLTPNTLATLMAAAQQLGVRVLVDPKKKDFSLYRGAFLVKPNLKEFQAACGAPVSSVDAIVPHALEMLKTYDIAHMVVTLSKRGMLWVSREGDVLAVPAQQREVYDVSGAGDTVIAVLGFALAHGAPFPEALQLATRAAAIVVQKVGTAVVTRAELAGGTEDSITDAGAKDPRAQVFSTHHDPDFMALCRQWQQAGLKVGFTNGCFDVLHAGHVTSLREAKRYCDRLIVGLNSDASVQRLKGPERPINAAEDRAVVLGALDSVDAVVFFTTDTPLELITHIRPDSLFKSEDYNESHIVGAKEVRQYGGQVHRLKFLSGISTTNLVEKIRQGSSKTPNRTT